MSMHSLPFDKPGRFYRGNLHCHSTRSDGTRDPATVVAAYRERGYEFVCLTDHFMERFAFPITDTRPFRTPDFTTLIGAELHGQGQENGDPWHIVAAGLPLDFPPPAPSETGPQIARRAADAGAFIGMAHPHWSSLTLTDAESLAAAHAVEVFNATCDLKWDRGDGWYVSDLFSAAGKRLTTYAADDAHFTAPADAFGAWVRVRAERLEPDALLAALKGGHYYSSEGPEISDIAVEGDCLCVACSADCAISVTGRGAGGRFRLANGLTDPITARAGLGEPQYPAVDSIAVTFPLDAFVGSYCRVTVTDAAGKRAWSNPIWLV